MATYIYSECALSDYLVSFPHPYEIVLLFSYGGIFLLRINFANQNWISQLITI